MGLSVALKKILILLLAIFFGSLVVTGGIHVASIQEKEGVGFFLLELVGMAIFYLSWMVVVVLVTMSRLGDNPANQNPKLPSTDCDSESSIMIGLILVCFLAISGIYYLKNKIIERLDQEEEVGPEDNYKYHDLEEPQRA